MSPRSNVVLIAVVMAVAFYGSANAGTGALDFEFKGRISDVSVRRAHELVVTGQRYFEQNEFDEALRRFSEASRLVPQMGTPHLLMGNVYYNQRHILKAIAEYTETIRLDLRNPTQRGH